MNESVRVTIVEAIKVNADETLLAGSQATLVKNSGTCGAVAVVAVKIPVTVIAMFMPLKISVSTSLGIKACQGSGGLAS